MIPVTLPEYWSSVHRPIEFVYDHEEGFLFSVTDSSGFAAFRIIGMFSSPTPVAGEKIYIAAGTYEGFHVISSVLGDVITTTTVYINGDTGSTSSVLFIHLPQIKVYSGYLPAEEYPDDLPLTVVATFTPENSPENNVQFDISEYLKSIFRIEPPTIGIDFSMFNRYRLHFDGAYQDFFMVLNSSIPTSELNELYVDTGAFLNSKEPPIVFGCGKTILSTLTGSVVTNYEFDGSTPDNGDYNNDFSNDFNNE